MLFLRGKVTYWRPCCSALPCSTLTVNLCSTFSIQLILEGKRKVSSSVLNGILFFPILSGNKIGRGLSPKGKCSFSFMFLKPELWFPDNHFEGFCLILLGTTKKVPHCASFTRILRIFSIWIFSIYRRLKMDIYGLKTIVLACEIICCYTVCPQCCDKWWQDDQFSHSTLFFFWLWIIWSQMRSWVSWIF